MTSPGSPFPRVLVRTEGPGDAPTIHRVHLAAFQREGEGAPPEAELVDRLRGSPAWIPELSFVAVADGSIVGHVVATRAHLEPGERPVLALGPIAVLPLLQAAGIGSALMRAVVEAADARDEPLIGLVGSVGWYTKFGFQPATALGVESPDPAWGEHFQVRVGACGADDVSGRFRYPEPFDQV
jgi:putative acetyltransferase